jgi:hypothetical protein
MRGRVTLILSHNCTVSLTSSFIAISSRVPPPSQEIDSPLSLPVSTSPSAQLPPRPTPTPPAADVASHRPLSANVAEDEDVPMASLTAHRGSPPRLADVASSQDFLGGDANADDDPSSGSHIPPPCGSSGGHNGTCSPLLHLSLLFIVTHPSPFPHPLVPNLTDSMDYDQYDTPIHAGSPNFLFLVVPILSPYRFLQKTCLLRCPETSFVGRICPPMTPTAVRRPPLSFFLSFYSSRSRILSF